MNKREFQAEQTASVKSPGQGGSMMGQAGDVAGIKSKGESGRRSAGPDHVRPPRQQLEAVQSRQCQL